MAYLVSDDDAVAPAVKSALIGLAGDLKTAEKAASGADQHTLLVRRALQSFDAYLAVGGYAQDGETITKAMNPLSSQLDELTKRLEQVEAMPVPGGPALRRPARPVPQTTEADVFRAKAAACGDPQMRAGYLQLAAESEMTK